MKKYEFTGETKEWYGRTLHQIRAVVSFGGVEAGEVGGWIEKEENLSYEGNARVWGNAWICSGAEVSKTEHYFTVGPAGSRNDFTTFYRDKDNEITVKCGCFLGKIDEFLKRVEKTHGDSKYAQVYRQAAELAKLQINLIKRESR